MTETPSPQERPPPHGAKGRDLLARLAKGPVVADGAMGTMLYAKGVYLHRCYDEVNLTAPELVEGIHREYLRAGAEVLETNSFGANPLRLDRHGLAERTEEINRRAAEIARGVAGEGAVVLGAMGPLGIRMEPWGPTSVAEAQALYVRQVRGLVEGGVDGFVLETFGDLSEIHAALLACREVGPGLPVVCQMTVDREGVGLYGTRPEDFGSRLDAWGADVIGINCSVGPQVMLGVLERLRTVTNRPLSVQPNAGPPREVEGRTMFLCTPDYLEKSARRFLEVGARLLGGCCGTTPDHIRALAKAVRRGRAVTEGAMTGGAVPATARAPAPAPTVVAVPELRVRSALGVRNLILITGDPPIIGDYPDATAVFDVDAIGLTNVASRLNRGLDLGGNATGPSTAFVIGVGLNPTATHLAREADRFRWKVDAGAEYAVTQPVFDPDALRRFLDLLPSPTIPVLAGIWPLQSVRNAEFLATEVPGVTIPDAVRDRLAAAGDAESQRRVGGDLAVEMALAVRDRVQGWQVSLPFGRVEAGERFLAGLRAVVPEAGRDGGDPT